mgnify:CR=1 FL=1|tara:strand:+ start:385 stop:903 length:519 start_codon:yes stop_codon:yes gene_type:complete
MVNINEERIKKIKEMKAWSDRKLKGAMAECIVEEMLRDAGYQVYRFGYEMVLQHLKGIKLEDNYVKRIITGMPDFIIVDRNNCPNFLEVKYRKDGELNISKDKLRIANLGKDWAESRLMIVSYIEPHFRISRVKEFIKSGKLFPLEYERFIKVNKKVIKRYGYLVRKYFEGK